MIKPTITQPIEDAYPKERPRNKNHAVVFSSDGKIEIQIYKYGNGRHCLYWRASDGTTFRKTATDRSKALNLAQEICMDLWQANGFGRRKDCRSLISQPRCTGWTRTRNIFNQVRSAPSADVEFTKFIPQQLGWRTVVRMVYSSNLTAATKVVLLYAYDRGFASGKFFASSETVANDTHLHHDHVQRILRKLAERGYFKRVGTVEGTRGVVRYALQRPSSEMSTTGDLKSPVEQDTDDSRSPVAATLGRITDDLKSPKADRTSRSDSSRASNRVLAPDGELRLLDEIRSVVGDDEMKKNAAMWRKRMQNTQREIKALRYTVEKYRAKTPHQKSLIRNRGAWFTDQYFRHLTEIDKAANQTAVETS
jgi:hypothetical protein